MTYVSGVFDCFPHLGKVLGTCWGAPMHLGRGVVLLHLLMTCFLLGNKRFSAAIAVDLLWVHVRDDLRMLASVMFKLKEGDAHVNAIFLCQVPRLCFV